MPDRDDPALSPAGRDRREAMLDEVLGAMRRVHRHRRGRRRALAPAALVLTLAWLSVVARPGAHRREVLRTVKAAPAPARVEIVQTDPTAVVRLAAPSPGRVRLIDDDTLLATLAALDRPAGLVRAGGRVWLTAPVVDGPGAP